MTDKPASETPLTMEPHEFALDTLESLMCGPADISWSNRAIRLAKDYLALERALRAAERKLDVAESERVKYVEKYEYACQRERAAEQRAERLEGELALSGKAVDHALAHGNRWRERFEQAEQSLAQERAARVRAEVALRAWKSAEDYQATYRHLSQAQEDIADAWQQATSLRDQALAQEGGKP